MRKLVLLLILVPILGNGQTQNVINYFRILPKAEKIVQLEKALVAHEQKYHTGNWKWRVFEIQTGPDAGGYQINEGPLSWTDFDGRGNLGAAHTADWENTVAPYIAHSSTMAYVSYLEEFSTAQLNDYADKITINHVYPKPGMVQDCKELVKKMKTAWQAGNESVAVYEASYSGEPQLITVGRLKAGLKELEEGFRKPLPERFNTGNGDGSWNAYLVDYARIVERRWSEMLFYRPDLSSK